MTSSRQFRALLSAVFAALTAPLAKIGATEIPADLATFARTAVVLGLAAIVATLTGARRSPQSIPLRARLAPIASGLATGASRLCRFRALKIGDAARVAPVDKLSVVLVAILATLLLGERLTPLGRLGVGRITAGAILTACGR